MLSCFGGAYYYLIIFIRKIAKCLQIITVCDYSISMKEMTRHSAGRIYLVLLLLSVIGFITFLAIGGTQTGPGEEPFLLFGWMTMPLVIGVIFVLFWLISYIIYFFFFWPYR